MTEIRLEFEGGTLRVSGPPDVERFAPHAVWDPRTGCHRAPAHRYAGVRDGLCDAGFPVDDRVQARIAAGGPIEVTAPDLRPYQQAALDAWCAHGRRGIVVLPTGAGKTRVAIAAMAAVRQSCLVLCPTRALLEQWERTLRSWYRGPVGIVGDGQRRVEALTVMTFASGYQRLDELGARFALVVVDEVHHFAGGRQAEALEMCPAPHRLGLTASAEVPGSEAAVRLGELVGPVVYEVALSTLLGTHLAPVDLVRHRIRLAPDERESYRQSYEPFAARVAALRRASPELDWPGVLRTLGRSAAGRAALAGLERALALSGFPQQKRELVGRLLERHWADRTLVFTALARDAYALSRRHLIPVITAEIGRAERHEILDRFRDGTYRAIASARVLNEGLDVPEASVAIVVGSRAGPREMLQRIGRVLRPVAGKRAVVHELITAGTLDATRAARRHDAVR
jgi:superfamily II DNA or RNA helicase